MLARKMMLGQVACLLADAKPKVSRPIQVTNQPRRGRSPGQIRTELCTRALSRNSSGSKEGGSQKTPELRQSVHPSQSPPPGGGIPQRTAFVGALAVVIGLTALAFWASQHWRLPWQKRRASAPDRASMESTETGRAHLPIDDLDVVIDDLPPRSFSEDKLEVQRLQAARVALERRLSQIDGSNSRRRGIPMPFVPPSDRPWRDHRSTPSLDQAIRESHLRSDPTADVSTEPTHSDAVQQMQQELDDMPKEVMDAEQAEIRKALKSLEASIDSPRHEGISAESSSATALPDLESGAGPVEEPLFSKASDLEWQEPSPGSAPQPTQQTSVSSPLSTDESRQQLVSARPKADEADTSHSDADARVPGASALDSNTSTSRAVDTSDTEPLPGLPDLHRTADPGEEEAVLSKASDIHFTKQPASGKEVAKAEANKADIDHQPRQYVRRSQKPVPFVEGQLRLVAAGACIPAPSKLAVGKSGEDAFFVSEALWGAVGVADGVGSWSMDGIDTSLFSRRLLEVAAAATENGWGRSRGQGVRGLMHIAQTGTMDVNGTSTACMALMMLGKTLQLANLGDSGFKIFRGAKLIFSSEAQLHSFNCPFQAGSPKLHPRSNTANDADVYELDLQPGDMVLMATDGVFDNLWDAELEKIAALHLKGEAGRHTADVAAALAEAIVEAAHMRGKDAKARTPWIVEAAKHQPDLLPWHVRLCPRGGKPDDCTAVVAFMQEDTNHY